MAKAKHNYKDSDFYDKIEGFAKRGYTDKNIAFQLDLSPETFYRMKNGQYEGWSSEENAERSERICHALMRGREVINAIVRDTYLKMALGQMKNKSVTKKYVEEKCECLGHDKKCPNCGGMGWVTLTDKSVTTETETQMANTQALATWLFNHDEEWRRLTIEGKRLDITSNGKDVVGTQLIFSPVPLTEKDIEEIKNIQNGTKEDSADTGISET